MAALKIEFWIENRTPMDLSHQDQLKVYSVVILWEFIFIYEWRGEDELS